MQDKRDLELAKLEDDLSLLEQHTKHVVSLLEQLPPSPVLSAPTLTLPSIILGN